MAIVTPKLLAKINLERVLFAERSSLAKVGDAGKRIFLNLWTNELLRQDFHVPVNEQADCLLFRSLVRDDYKKLSRSIKDSLQGVSFIEVEDYREGRRTPVATPSELSIKYAWLLDYINESCSLTRACLFIRLCQYVMVLEALFSNRFKLLLLFADMQSVENFAAQVARQLGIPSVTLQHGLYVDYGAMNTVNVINYLHHEADVFLAWGENTKRLIERYHPEADVRICGKPNVFDAAGGAHTKIPRNHYIYVVIDQSIFDQQNEQMLSCLVAAQANHDYDIYVKFHPLSDKSAFFKKFPSIKEGASVEGAAWVVGHTSSLMYEALSLGKRVLRYRSDIPALELAVDNSFGNEEELMALLTDGNINYQALAEDLIAVQGDESKQRYANHIISMLEAGSSRV